jgi:hypothetical protein
VNVAVRQRLGHHCLESARIAPSRTLRDLPPHRVALFLGQTGFRAVRDPITVHHRDRFAIARKVNELPGDLAASDGGEKRERGGENGQGDETGRGDRGAAISNARGDLRFGPSLRET